MSEMKPPINRPEGLVFATPTITDEQVEKACRAFFEPENWQNGHSPSERVERRNAMRAALEAALLP
jgi:hypothetical protein